MGVLGERLIERAVSEHSLVRSRVSDELAARYDRRTYMAPSDAKVGRGAARGTTAKRSSKSSKATRKRSVSQSASASQSSSTAAQREAEARGSPAKKCKVQRVRPAKWKELERSAFLTHLAEVGDDWCEMQKRLPSRTLMQIRSYYSKNKQKLKLGAIVERARARARTGRSNASSSSASAGFKAEPQLDAPVKAPVAPLEVPAVTKLKVEVAVEDAADAMEEEQAVAIAVVAEEAAKEESVAQQKPEEEQEMAKEEQEQLRVEALPQPDAAGPAPAPAADAAASLDVRPALGDDGTVLRRKRAREEEGEREEGAMEATVAGAAPTSDTAKANAGEGPAEKRARPTTDDTRQAWR